MSDAAALLPAERLRRLSSVGHLLDALPHEALLRASGVERLPALHAPRFGARLRERAARRIDLAQCAGIVDEKALVSLIAGGADAVRALVTSVGIMCHEAALRLVVDVATLQKICDRLACDAGFLRLHTSGRNPMPARAFRLRSHDGLPDSLASAVLVDGALCWRSWVSQRPKPVIRYLRLLTPDDLWAQTQQVTPPGLRETAARARLTAAALAARKSDA